MSIGNQIAYSVMIMIHTETSSCMTFSFEIAFNSNTKKYTIKYMKSMRTF